MPGSENSTKIIIYKFNNISINNTKSIIKMFTKIFLLTK